LTASVTNKKMKLALFLKVNSIELGIEYKLIFLN
jgi:hypothetical protein